MSHATGVTEVRPYGWEGPLDANAVAVRRAAEAKGLRVSVETHLDARGRIGAAVCIAIGPATYLYARGILRVRARPDGPPRHINGTATQITMSKGAARAVLAAAGLSVPRGRVFDATHEDAAVDYALAFPNGACVKPENRARGAFVFPRCQGRAAIGDALKAVLAACSLAVVEESVEGGVFRFFYVEPGIVGARQNRPVTLVGDGRSTILDLLNAANAERRRRSLPGHDPLHIDLTVVNHLASKLLTLKSVLPAGKRIEASPVSQFAHCGGEVVNLGAADIHPSYATQALAAFRAIDGLRIGAIDMKIVDPLEPAARGNHWILEVNSSPSIESVATPWVGAPQDVAGAIVALIERHAASLPEASGEEDLDPHAAVLRDVAARRGLATQVVQIAKRTHLRLAVGGVEYNYRSGVLRRADPSRPDSVGFSINAEAKPTTSSKARTKDVLAAAGISVPAGECFKADALDAAIAFAAALGRPVCVKPDRGKQGHLVFPQRCDTAQVAAAFRRVAREYDDIIVEESVSGDEFRFFYVAPRAVAAKESVTPGLTGDGTNTVLALLAEKGRRERGLLLANQTAVSPNHDLVALLAEQGLGLECVPERGRRVRLRLNANGTMGGAHIECRDTIHPSLWRVAEAAFQAIPGLVIATLDMIAADRNAPATESGYWVLEINSAPGLLPFHFPWEGRPQDVSGAILDYLEKRGAGQLAHVG